METKKTNREVLVKGLKIMGISLGAMFLGPLLIYIAFINQEKPLYIPILIVAIIVCGLAIYLAFKGLNTILDSMFKK
ncbi:DUF6095 family protein [Flavivirga aquimarina]|uniref:DUF6095 family protein n=1 Tax=Flavivirga aquimarina TaxID=2027862 RepID=A0ABT8W5U3_9FLAO|nr:DUF6095 family protein [Flavivirga aquimarina]MDO5968467.1 DUF6095 family protein [Flavivirga aquimarina]